MHHNIYLRSDGIIGSDLLIKYKSVLDLNEEFILLRIQENSSEILQEEVKHLSSFKIKNSSGTCNDHTDDMYFNLLENYIEYEKNLVYTLKQKKKVDPSFYDRLSESTFQNYVSFQVEKCLFDDFNTFSLYDVASHKPFKINKINEFTEND